MISFKDKRYKANPLVLFVPTFGGWVDSYVVGK